jgi:outer membrane receptor for monomeric catechols
MPTGLLRTVAVVAVCFCNGAVAGERPRHAPAVTQGAATSSRSTDAITARPHAPGLKRNAARRPAADREPYADPAAPYKANRLSWSRQPILNIPGQTTVLTRQVLDDMKATSTTDALRSTAGVTVGR